MCSIRGAQDAAKYKDCILPLIFTKRLGLEDVEADIIGKSYEYLIRKFAENSGKSTGEIYTPGEVSEIMARTLSPDSGMETYDPTCGSGSLLIRCKLAMEAKMRAAKETNIAPVKLFGQEYVPETWAIANMNMIIHDMKGKIEIGDTFKNPRFRNVSIDDSMVESYLRVFKEIFVKTKHVAHYEMMMGIQNGGEVAEIAVEQVI